jgi:hypothetical protein
LEGSKPAAAFAHGIWVQLKPGVRGAHFVRVSVHVLTFASVVRGFNRLSRPDTRAALCAKNFFATSFKTGNIALKNGDGCRIEFGNNNGS